MRDTQCSKGASPRKLFRFRYAFTKISWQRSSSSWSLRAKRAAIPKTLRLCRRTNSANASSSPARVDWMRRSSVGSSMAAFIARTVLVCRDAVGNSMKESINASVNIDLHILELLQLVRREHGANVVRDMGALHRQVGLQRSDFRDLLADGGLVDGLRTDDVTQRAPFGHDFLDERSDGWLVFAKDDLHLRFLVGGQTELRQFQRETALAETDIIGGIRVGQESEESAHGCRSDCARCDQ